MELNYCNSHHSQIFFFLSSFFSALAAVSYFLSLFIHPSEGWDQGDSRWFFSDFFSTLRYTQLGANCRKLISETISRISAGVVGFLAKFFILLGGAGWSGSRSLCQVLVVGVRDREGGAGWRSPWRAVSERGRGEGHNGAKLAYSNAGRWGFEVVGLPAVCWWRCDAATAVMWW